MVIENSVMVRTSISTVDKANIGYLNARTSIIGSFTVSCRQTNNRRAMPPAARAQTTSGSDQDTSPALLKPNTMPPKPTVDRRIENSYPTCLCKLQYKEEY